MADEQWRLDHEGQLDDVVVPDVTLFRMERMDANAWWIGLTMPDGRTIHVDLVAEQSGVIAHRRED